MFGKAIADDTQGTGQREQQQAGRSISREKKQRGHNREGEERIQKKHNNKRQEDISQIIITLLSCEKQTRGERVWVLYHLQAAPTLAN